MAFTPYFAIVSPSRLFPVISNFPLTYSPLYSILYSKDTHHDVGSIARKELTMRRYVYIAYNSRTGEHKRLRAFVDSLNVTVFEADQETPKYEKYFKRIESPMSYVECYLRRHYPEPLNPCVSVYDDVVKVARITEPFTPEQYFEFRRPLERGCE